MNFSAQFYNTHFDCHITRTYQLTNEVEVKPLMMSCLEHFFCHLNNEIDPMDIKVTRQAPTKEGCRYDISFSYRHPVTRRAVRRTRKYTIHPITKELLFK